MKNNVIIIYRLKGMRKAFRLPFRGTDSEILRKMAGLRREGFCVSIERA